MERVGKFLWLLDVRAAESEWDSDRKEVRKRQEDN
jgi:hypothetical protein